MFFPSKCFYVAIHQSFLPPKLCAMRYVRTLCTVQMYYVYEGLLLFQH